MNSSILLLKSAGSHKVRLLSKSLRLTFNEVTLSTGILSIAHAEQLGAHIRLPLVALADAVMVAVRAMTLHPVTVVQSIDRTLLTVGLAVFPFKNDVDSEIILVQYGTAVFLAQDDALADEVMDDVLVEDGSDFDAEPEGSSLLSLSLCKSSPRLARVSVRVSISFKSGTGTSTSLRLSTTCTAQLRSLAISPSRSVIPDIRLLSEIKLLKFFIEVRFLFVFLLEHCGFTVGLMSKSSNRARVSTLVFATLSRYWVFKEGSVIHRLLLWSDKKRPPSKAASDVATAPDMVVDGARKKGKDSVGTVSEALKEPL